MNHCGFTARTGSRVPDIKIPTALEGRTKSAHWVCQDLGNTTRDVPRSEAEVAPQHLFSTLRINVQYALFKKVMSRAGGSFSELALRTTGRPHTQHA